MRTACGVALAAVLAACHPPTVKAVEFSLTDINPNSPRANQAVAPHDYSGKVSAWYFGHST